MRRQESKGLRTLSFRDDTIKQVRIINAPTTNPALEAALQPFIDDLTIPQRDAILRTDRGGMTARDAAAQLGISHVAVLKNRDNARENLRRALTTAALSDDYADIKRMLLPSRRFLSSGEEDLWEEVRCIYCDRANLAKFRPDDEHRGQPPLCSCGDHVEKHNGHGS